MLRLSRNKENKENRVEIAFYVDAAAHGSHGKIRVSHRRHGLTDAVVNWVLVGMTDPLDITPDLINEIWSQAKEQGYVPHGLVGCLEVNRAPTLEEKFSRLLGSLPQDEQDKMVRFLAHQHGGQRVPNFGVTSLLDTAAPVQYMGGAHQDAPEQFAPAAQQTPNWDHLTVPAYLRRAQDTGAKA